MARPTPSTLSLADIAQVDQLNHSFHLLYNAAPAQALECAQETRQLAEQIGYTLGLARALGHLGLAEVLLGNYAGAKGHLLESVRLAEVLGDEYLQAAGLNTLGGLSVFTSDLPRALEYFVRALALERSLGARLQEGHLLNNIASVYRDLGDYTSALNYQKQCLSIERDLGDVSVEAASLTSLAELHHLLNQPQQALELGLDALHLQQKIADPGSEAYVRVLLGELYTLQGAYPQAQDHLQQALNLLRQTDDQASEADALRQLGMLHHRMSQQGQALEVLGYAAELAQLIGDSERHIRLLLVLGQTHPAHSPEALHYLEQALEQAELAGMPILQRDVLESLSEVHAMKGDFALAFAQQKRLREIEKSLYSEIIDRRVKGLKVQSETERSLQATRMSQELATAHVALETASREQEQLRIQLSQQAELLERRSQEDGLTGLYNRSYLESFMVREFSRSKRGNHPLCVAIADIDHLRQINDAFSHAVGDAVLLKVTEIFVGACRSSDLIARYGGEEFALVFTDTDLGAARLVCERLREKVEAYDWNSLSAGLSVTLSFGLSPHLEAANHEKLLSLADQQLCRAKLEGRNRVCS